MVMLLRKTGGMLNFQKSSIGLIKSKRSKDFCHYDQVTVENNLSSFSAYFPHLINYSFSKATIEDAPLAMIAAVHLVIVYLGLDQLYPIHTPLCNMKTKGRPYILNMIS